MKLWIISQTEMRGYDTYDSAVVAANTEEEARHTHPNQFVSGWNENTKEWYSKREDGTRYKPYGGDWATTPDNVEVELIGATMLPAGLVLSSFNAG